MQSFTVSELSWMSTELEKQADRMEHISKMVAATKAERELYHLRAEQFSSMAQKLRSAVENGDRRIEIRRN